MNLVEINNRINDYIKDPSLVGNISELDSLLVQKKILEAKSPVFHFTEPMTVGEIQFSAKVIKAILTKDPYSGNTDSFNCPMPVEADNDWNNLKTKYQDFNKYFFGIECPNFDRIYYNSERSVQISDVELNISLQIAQNTFKELSEGTLNFDIKAADSFVDSFIIINSAITNYFLKKDMNADCFDWNAKYNPCYFDRQRILQFRGLMMLGSELGINDKKLAVYKKYVLRDFGMQLKYLTFWVGLLDTATFPGIDAKYSEVFNNLVDYLLAHYSNIYIYDIVTESNPIVNSAISNARGSESNTTRIKIFFTEYDDIPRLMRLDLPHVDTPYVHLNIENLSTGENVHERLSSDESFSGEYDGLFEPLIETLRSYNFYTISSRHSGVAEDRLVRQEMKIRIALYNYSIKAYYYCVLQEKTPNMYDIWFEKSKNTIIELLVGEGFNWDELKGLDPYSLFTLADEAMNKKGLLP